MPSPFASQVDGSTPVVTGPVCAGAVGWESLLATACLWRLCLPVAEAVVPPVCEPVDAVGSVVWGGTVTVTGGGVVAATGSVVAGVAGGVAASVASAFAAVAGGVLWICRVFDCGLLAG